MKLSVYYDEIDGLLNPQWMLMLIPCNTSEEYITVAVDAPFERFWPEDFHDALSVTTVTQAALTKDPFNNKQFSVHIPTVLSDLKYQNKSMDIDSIDYFLVRLDDLEELLLMNVRSFFSI
ncbi:hypothetical protein [Bacillus sp. JCM 19034]|uniref:hypothetical protein n=1 Tax=Bacillus sp. JCM 19034 TaxID=1481928 RepID=UPI000782DC01|nr:hypothetical protein [Bacillus sp. JCM 19034]